MDRYLFSGERVSDNEPISGFLSWNQDKSKYYIGKWIDMSSHGHVVKTRVEEEVFPQTVVMDNCLRTDFLFRGKSTSGDGWVYGYLFWNEEMNEYHIGRKTIIEGKEREVSHRIYTASISQYTGRRDIRGNRIFLRQPLKMWDMYGEMVGVATYYNGSFYFENKKKILKSFSRIKYIEILTRE